MTTKMNITKIHKLAVEEKSMRLNKKFSVRWIMIGLLLILLAYAGLFFNYHLVYAGIAEEVSIQSGEIQLNGMLVRPDIPGPYPAVVIFHGAGHNEPYSKWYYRILTNVFVRQGFAALSYDKRGTGGTEDDYQTVTFQDLINDGVAAVALLRNQSDILPDQIGLVGMSESGWFTPEIAASSGDIAFIVNKVGPPLPWITTVLFEVKNDALAVGVSEADLKDALTLKARIYQFYIDAASDESVANGLEREALDALLANMQNRPGIEDLVMDEK